MSLTPLELAKAHLRVEHDDEDALIQVFIDSAEDSVNKYCDREAPFEVFPDAVQSAVLLIVGNLYENRESMTVGQEMHVNRTIAFLLDPYKELRS
nr:MAG TPA: Head Tail Connector Protein [Caudoviricetes sp.]